MRGRCFNVIGISRFRVVAICVGRNVEVMLNFKEEINLV